MESSYGGEENEDYSENQRKLKPASVIILFLLSVLISVAGGSVLGWWLHKYHPDNRELWMVPFGLIFLLTPIVIWFSLIVSDLFVSNRKEGEKVILRRNQPFRFTQQRTLFGTQIDGQKR